MHTFTLSLFVASSAHAGPHADQVAEFGHLLPERPGPRAAPPPLPPPSAGPDMKVYGYLAYWNDELATLRWDELSHVAIFSANATSTGDLTDTSRWDIADDAVAMGAPYGVRVHLVVTNFDPTSLRTLLGSATNRQNLIDELVAWKASTGAHGINIDFEGLPSDRRNEMLTFVEELEAAVGEVVLATPAVDWSGAWDYSELSKHADLFIMGYDYFWSGSSYAGPSDPLTAGTGTVWAGVNGYSIAWTLDDYLFYDADPDRVILGLPLYGRSWPTAGNGVPTATLGTGSTLLYADGWEVGAAWGATYEPDAASLYSHDGSAQYWYGDVATVQERIVYARDVAGVSGVGFWALHYDDDDPLMWDMIRGETTGSATTTDPGTTPTDPGTTPTDPGTTPTDPGTTTEPTPTDPDTTDDLQPPLGAQALQPEPKGGCGCAASPTSGGLGLLLAVQLMVRARRTPTQARPRPTAS